MPDNPPIMQCGHAANSTFEVSGVTYPCCAICFEDAGSVGAKIAKDQPNLEGRTAVCAYCRKAKPSIPNLAFFQHLPDNKYDTYYCGCRGWD